MMIGIAIVSVLLAIAVPNFKVWLQNARIRNTAESILHGLQLARSEAVLRNATVQFALENGSGWKVKCVFPSATCPENIQSRPAGDGADASITVTPSHDMPIQISGLGTMVLPALAGGATFTRIDVDINPSALPAAQSRELRITVDVGGAIRMCDPSITTLTDSRRCP